MILRIVLIVFAFNTVSCTARQSDTPVLVDVVPFEMDGAHILVYANVNGSDPVPFTFDTGGGTSLIDTEKADEIGLKTTGTSQAQGAGGNAQFQVTRSNTIKMGNLTFEDCSFLTISLAHMRQLGAKTYGVLGYEQISKYVVKIDYEENKLYFYDKKRYKYDGDGKEIPIKLESRIPSVEAQIELEDGTTVSGRFLIDTGAAMYASMNTPSVVEYDAIGKLSKSFEVLASGATGEFKLINGRVNKLKLGESEFSRLPFMFNTINEGALADPDFVGIIGNRVMRRYNIILDYRNDRMILEPNRFYDDAFRVNASGLLILAEDDDRLVVSDVIADSPAAKLGIQKGDEIISVDDIQGTTQTRPAIRSRLEEAGRTVKIVWKRDGEIRQDSLLLENII
ncbi:MAG: aspartyl protease family protein [Bacteroidota bacterium]